MRDLSPLSYEAQARAKAVHDKYWAARSNPPRPSTNANGERGPVIISVDVGQVSDYTAILVAEIEKREDSEGVTRNHYNIRHIERMRGVSYQSQVDRCKQIYEKLNRSARFVVDASGARPIYDLFKNAGLPILPISITAGTSSRIEHGYGYVSKLELATLLQVISSAGRIHLPPKSKYSKTILDEARAFSLSVSDAGNLKFSAEGSKKDDLIMALCYLLWLGERGLGERRPKMRWI
jgi:hypothetical protein